MNLTDAILGNSEAQAERWLRKQEKRPVYLKSWRTPERQRMLRIGYNLTLALGVLTAIVCFFWLPATFAWVFFTIAVCTIWIMMRATIDEKDTAPAAALDEYENQVLNTWRSLAFGVATTLFTALAVAMMVLAVMNPDNLRAYLYSLSLLTLVTLFSLISLPVFGYSLAFYPTQPQED
ncbi:hypothetical protein [Corynebacterium lowii]|uniref:Uncharacterized protein n=1 Tax=Corynebacterium lowii TaxID=1544413 RepID=A0A0Q0YQY8_9CORY|nr:hypothetical protein [Corynebacterium lowii]KQB84836.1 hypothetical protein Clow_02098 [Corynebacterium lowii]MDP9851740.1 membrane protein YdbS with pleckstrin-like domain [Corynebacterium lowii]